MNNDSIIPQKSKEVQVSSEEFTSEQAFNLDTEIKQLKNNLNGGFLLLAEKLKTVRDMQLYKTLNYDTFEEYIAQPELSFNRSSVFEFISIYEKFVLELKVQPAGLILTDWSKLQVIKPFVNEENVNELLTKAKELSRSDLRKEIQEEKFKSLPKPEVPQDKYEVIVIDPPWPYGTVYDPEYRRVGNPYPEMELDEIKNSTLGEKNISDISADNSIVWLWTTHKFLPHSFDLLSSWGYEYKATMVWDKQKMGMGYWLRMQAEFCLLGIKGKPTWYLENERDVLAIARKEHSRKPDEFYEMVKKLSPDTKRIDIFSREKREGFEQYGNEPDKF